MYFKTKNIIFFNKTNTKITIFYNYEKHRSSVGNLYLATEYAMGTAPTFHIPSLGTGFRRYFMVLGFGAQMVRI